MLFNSNEFLVFFALFCTAYVLVRNSLAARNRLIVVASYVFYGSWDYRFAGLLLLTSGLDFTLARLIEGTGTDRRRRALLAASVGLNLGVLALFKYFNFFRESLEGLLSTWGVESHWKGWQIVLPIGISFYTFQSMSYVVDVYRRRMPASRDLIQFLAYVSFFPQLVAGPIERGTHLLPQFNRPLPIRAADLEAGVWLIIWGLFKKVVLADNLAPLVELVYQHAAPAGPMVVLGTIAFALQIYCDFSGYSDIACGLARLFGFNLMLNFNLPYLATSLRDFWRRWHISLSTWLRDYLYVPLGGSRGGEGRTYLNLGITMLLGGLWHGAALTFLLWGLWHGLGLMANRWWEQRGIGRKLPSWSGWLVTQALVLYGWLLFRANSLDQVLQMTRALTDWSVPRWWGAYLTNLVVLASPLLAMQAWQWRSGKLDAPLTLPLWARAGLQATLLLTIMAFWAPEASPFIYFQF
ncbi:MAG TPA: MBOAT family protein [Candidatus Sulfotelmatobacter sp.]|nr:MBOAT family protein [Candidatus Sulfotelmatobacter sp.]